MKKILASILALCMLLSTMGTVAFADEPENKDRGYYLCIYNADGTLGMDIDGTKSSSDFSLRTAIEDARVFVDNAFLFDITTPATYVVEMYEDSTETESFEVGSDVTINGNGHNIVLEKGVELTNNGIINNATVVESAPAETIVAKIGNAEFTSFNSALEAAQSGDTITLVADITDTAITVDKNLTITGNVSANNVTINAVEGCSELTVSNLSFTGNSWINSGAADKLTVSGVKANVTPSNAAYTNSRSAFISLGRSEQKALELVVENCNIVSAGGSDPILGWAAITDATISGNTFGSASAYQENSDSVKFMGIADGATITVTGNTVYSNYNGFVFSQNTTRENAYTAIIDDNDFVGTADHIWIEVSGSNTTNAIINASSDNTVNGKEFTVNDIKVHPNINTWTSYAGVDVVTDSNGKVIGGQLAFAADDVIADGYTIDADGNVIIEYSLSGLGTQEAPYLIDSIEALKWFRDDVNAGNTYEGKYIKVTATEIDLSGENWTSIGNGTRNGCGFGDGTVAFKGIFDGNGVTIKGLTIENTADDVFVGLFGAAEGAIIKNITLENVNIKGGASSTTAALVGGMIGGTVSDITVSGTVTATEGAGVVGRIFADGTVKNCTNSANVTATGNSAAGIVGKAYYTREDKSMLIENCTNNGAIKSAYVAGGIVALSAGNVKNCTNTGTVEAIKSAAGGIVGEQSNNGTVSGNKNSANITSGYNAGGIVGWVRYTGTDADYPVRTPIRVINNVNNGETIASTGAEGAAGGIVGEVYNRGIINNNKNYAESISATGFAAGIAGALRHGSDGNAYIDDNDVDVYYNISTTPIASITAACTDLFGYDNETTGTELDVNYNYTEDFHFEFEITTKVNGVESADAYKIGDIVTVTVSVPGDYEWIYGGLSYDKTYFKAVLYDFGGYISINERYETSDVNPFEGNFLNEYEFEVIKVPEEDKDLDDNFFKGEFTADAEIVINEQLANHSEAYNMDAKTATVNIHEPYSVTFDVDGNKTTVSGITNIDTLEKVKPVDPVLEGYVFDGWTLDGVLVSDEDMNKPVERGNEYVAQFSTSVTFVVDENETKIGGIVKGTKFGDVSGKPDTTKQYHVFEGWTLGSVIVEDEAIVVPNGVYTALYSVDCEIVVTNDYVTGYYLVQVYGDAKGYKFDGNSMYKVIHEDMTNYTLNGKVARSWIVSAGENGFAPTKDGGYTDEEFDALVRERLTVVNTSSMIIDVGYNVNGVNTDTDIIDIADAYSAYCVAIPTGKGNTTVEIKLASDIDGSRKVDNDDSKIIIEYLNTKQ